jgi:hypothetical protein
MDKLTLYQIPKIETQQQHRDIFQATCDLFDEVSATKKEFIVMLYGSKVVSADITMPKRVNKKLTEKVSRLAVLMLTQHYKQMEESSEENPQFAFTGRDRAYALTLCKIKEEHYFFHAQHVPVENRNL